MTFYRRAAINGGALGFLIVLVILTILFSVLTYTKAERSRVVYEGDPEDQLYKQDFCLKSMLGQVSDLDSKVEQALAMRQGRMDYINELDHKLISLSTYYDDTTRTWLARTASDDPANGAYGTRLLQVHNMQQVLQRLQRLKTIQEEMTRKGFPKFDDQAVEYRRLSGLEVEKSTKIEDRLRQDKDKLTKDIELYSREKLQAAKDFRGAKASMLINISQLDSQIRELLELRLNWLKDIEPDGTVLYSDLEHKFAFINRGSSHGVAPGLKFEVFQYVKGQILSKGMVEVTSIDDFSSRCRILSEIDPRDNGIIDGDLIGNPIFCPGDPKTFFLAGEFDSFNQEDLERFIRQMGGHVATKLEPGIDFMVAGKNSDKLQDSAREFQVIAMTEEQLVKYLSTRFQPLSDEEMAIRARETAELEALRQEQEKLKSGTPE